MFAWGNNGRGNLGDGTTVSKSSPVQIGSSSWTAVTATTSHTAGISSNNLLYAWGYNTSSGRLGDGTIISRSSPTLIGNNEVLASNRSSPVQIGTSSWTAVSVGTSHVGAISSSNRLYTWGVNNWGQLGQNNIINSSLPVQVGTRSFTLVSAGQLHTIAR